MKVLIVNSDQRTLTGHTALLESHGFHVTAADPVTAALTCTGSQAFDAIILLIDERNDQSTALIREFGALGIDSRVIVITSAEGLHSAVDVVRGCTNGPEFQRLADDLAGSTGRAMGRADHEASDAEGLVNTEPHALERWAAMVIAGIQSRSDPKTLHRWARDIGVSYGALRNWCRTAHLSAKNSLRLTRLLRATVLHEKHHRRFEDLLDIVDLRTLRKLLQRAGIDPAGQTCGDVESAVERFLNRQTFIDDPQALTHLRANLRALASRAVAAAPHAGMANAELRAAEIRALPGHPITAPKARSSAA